MLYALYTPDGKIHQANKVYDPSPGYDKLLNDEGYKFVKADAPGLLPPEQWYVDVKAEELCERPVMSIEISKTVIKAGDDDSALLTGIPKGAKFEVATGGSLVWSGVMDGAEELEVSMPVPCKFVVVINLWPFRSFNAEIEVIP